MKKSILVAVLMLSLIAFYECGRSTPKETTPKIQEGDIAYTCEMHPEVISDKPGNCPKCGMNLIKKEVTTSDSVNMEHTDSSIQEKIIN